MALVIERKKLSPEARKQTRAAESLKMTSKIKFQLISNWNINISIRYEYLIEILILPKDMNILLKYQYFNKI